MQRPTDKHQMELRESCGGEGDRLGQAGVSRKPQEDLQSQPTWGHGGSQNLGDLPGSMGELDLDPLCICSKYAAGSPNK